MLMLSLGLSSKQKAKAKHKPKSKNKSKKMHPIILSPAWLHNLSPYAINFEHGFGIRWYGLA